MSRLRPHSISPSSVPSAVIGSRPSSQRGIYSIWLGMRTRRRGGGPGTERWTGVPPTLVQAGKKPRSLSSSPPRPQSLSRLDGIPEMPLYRGLCFHRDVPIHISSCGRIPGSWTKRRCKLLEAFCYQETGIVAQSQSAFFVIVGQPNNKDESKRREGSSCPRVRRRACDTAHTTLCQRKMETTTLCAIKVCSRSEALD